MGQSLVDNYMHFIFSTKHRKPLITYEIENELFAYLGGICKNLDSQPIRIGGHLDHVHILCNVSKNITVIKLLEEVKKCSF